MTLTPRKKLLIYKILLFALAFVIVFMPSTASRSREVNSRVIVEMIGVDGKNGEVELTAQYVMPTETDGATSKDKLTVKAETVPQAAEALNTALGRRAELGHCSMVILGADAEPELLASLMGATDVTADVYVAAAKEKASDLVGDITDFMKKTGATDADFIAYSAKKSHIATNTILVFLSDLGSKSHTAFAPLVEMLEEEKSGGGSGGAGGSGGSDGGQGGSGGEQGGSGSGQSEATGMKVEKLAVYSPSGRVGMLEREAARGVAWVSAPVENSVITADRENGGKPEKLSGKLKKKSARVKLDAKTLSATVCVKATIDPIGNVYNSVSGGGNAEIEVKAAFAEAIKKDLESGFNEAKQMGLDPMFILREFYRYAPDVSDAGITLDGIDVGFDVEIILK